MSTPTQPGQPDFGPHPQQPHRQQPHLQPEHSQHPHPGLPMQPPAPERRSWFARHKILTGIGVLVAIGIVGAALGGGQDDTPAGPQSAASAPAEGTTPGDDTSADDDAATEPADTEPADTEPVDTDDAASDDAGDETPATDPAQSTGIGVPAQDGNFEFTVTSVETGIERIGNDFLHADAQGRFVLVHVTVTNVGNEARRFDGSNQSLIDDLGRTHSADTTAAIYLEDSNSFLNQINPGNSVAGVVVFDIPADAEPASLELHDSMFSGGVTVDLG